MSVQNFKDLRRHLGHATEVVMYGHENVTLECTECSEVILEFDKEE